MRRGCVKVLLALAVLGIAVAPVGSAVFYLGFVRGDSPCVMCWEQRIGMMLFALIGLFVLRYGPKPRYVGLAVIVAASLFRQGSDSFDEVSRGRFATVRARMMYTLSAAFDPERNSIDIVTVPNARSKRLVISRFDRNDMTLSEEFSPTAGTEVAVRGNASLDQLYVRGTVIDRGRLYAISAAGSVVVAIDLATHAVVGAHTIPGITKPAGIAIRGDELFVVSEGGELTVVSKPI